MRLNSLPAILTGLAKSNVEDLTRDVLVDSMTELFGTLVELRGVDVDIFDQELVQTTRRRLQQPEPPLLPLRVGFDVEVSYRTAAASLSSSPPDWVALALDTVAEQEMYIERLQARNTQAFATVTSMRVRVDGQTVGETNESPSGAPTDSSTVRGKTFWIIVAASGGGGTALLLCIILILCLTRRKKPKKQHATQKHHPHKPPPTKVTYEEANNNMQFAAEIHLQQRQDDISTLGDPFGGGMHMGAGVRDERTASVGHDYDYAKHAFGRQNSLEAASQIDSKMSSALGPMDHTIQDVESFDQQFGAAAAAEQRLEFEVPAGKLGMVIDTPQGHSPLVHAVKPGSVLDGKVQVGDFLIQVNHQDVTEWTAVKVSKYISALSGRARLLVFHRTTRQRTESSVFLEDGSV